MIGPDGKPKILDFGLAKAFLPEDGVSAEMAQSPTLTKGTALGTTIIQIPTEGGGAPAWARNGEELFYSRFIEGDPEGKTEMWSVDVTEGTELRVGQPRLLFRTERMRTSAVTRSYDVNPDGQRFLIVVPEERGLPEFTLSSGTATPSWSPLRSTSVSVTKWRCWTSLCSRSSTELARLSASWHDAR